MSCGRPREPACQQLNRSQIKPRLAAGNGRFEILRQPPVATKPAEGSLDHPAPWQYLKTCRLVRSLDDLKRPLPKPGKSGFQLLAGVSAVGKDVTQPGEEIADRRQYPRRPVAILDVGGVHLDANQITRCPLVSVMNIGMAQRTVPPARRGTDPERDEKFESGSPGGEFGAKPILSAGCEDASGIVGMELSPHMELDKV